MNPAGGGFYCATAVSGDEFGVTTPNDAKFYNYYHNLKLTESSINTQSIDAHTHTHIHTHTYTCTHTPARTLLLKQILDATAAAVRRF